MKPSTCSKLKIKPNRLSLYNAYDGRRLVSSADSASDLACRLVNHYDKKPIFNDDVYGREISKLWDEYHNL